MAFRRQWLLILLTLFLGGKISLAAGAAKEQRAYAAAVSAFEDAMWSRAETAFAQFIQKYPKSTNAPSAVLLQAQAEFKQGKFANAITLLGSRRPGAGDLAGQYDSWIGEAQFAGSNFVAAAATFSALAKNCLDPALQLSALVKAAAADDQLGDWPRLDALLEETNGIFARAAQLDPGNEWIVSGQLLRAHSKNAQGDFSGGLRILQGMNPEVLRPEQAWQWAYLLCRNRLAAGDLAAALAATTNLLSVAQGSGVRGAESVKLHAELLEKLNRPAEAVAAYQQNLTNAPVAYQRDAILKITELSIAQGQFTGAEQSLGNFLARFPGSSLADLALFTSGELHLKDYIVSRTALAGATNQLSAAKAQLDQFLDLFPNRPLAGKAYLDRGWCNWFLENVAASLADFKAAAERLPPSEDLAVATFKTGDALFAEKDFSGALENYRAVLEDFEDFPAVLRTLGLRALYQSLRADLELNDMAGAGAALARILQIDPAGDFADSSTLLFGEGVTASPQPSDARVLFEKFEGQFTNSLLRPQVELAVARTFEREQNWTNAIARYERWLGDYPTNELRPQAAYALALANFQAGDETNAFRLFTNFIGQFPTDANAPLAQWWVAEHFFRLGDFVNAERNYKSVFQNTNWQGSPLVYPAQLMAGRAAAGWGGYADAIGFFTGLAGDTNCPPELDVQARFAWGSALMLSDPADTNNALANFQAATNVFGQICRLYPTNELGILAWVEISKCDLQLTNYDAATNACAQVFNSPLANVSARSQAQVGFGVVLEKKAAGLTGNDQTNLLQLALDSYLQVFETWTGNGLRSGETADAFWVKKAGLQAADLVGTLGKWQVAVNLYSQLEGLLPQLKNSLEKKITAAREHLSPENSE